MILIVGSKEENTVQEIISWLDFFKQKTCVIEHCDLENITYSLSLNDNKDEIIFNQNGGNISLEDIKMVWFRKSSFNRKNDLHLVENKPRLHQRLSFHLERELWGFKNSLYNIILNSKPCLGDPEKNDINKIYSLINAKKAGLKIPSTLISTRKENSNVFVNNNKNVITKTIQDSVMVWENDRAYSLYTNSVNNNEINEADEFFFPSLFQEEVIKEYEIRTFFLNGTCYSMAIFSQSDQKTQVDYRDYNWKKMNRMVPYKLPSDIEKKIIKFMSLINLSTGSIDLIKSIQGEYIFLEINPVGQFGFVSSHCNYYLEEEMAKYLSEN
jgi:ATP-GRASP peptide maturase of grasp-with-spasm system